MNPGIESGVIGEICVDVHRKQPAREGRIGAEDVEVARFPNDVATTVLGCPQQSSLIM